jgi:hypothetical protein
MTRRGALGRPARTSRKNPAARARRAVLAISPIGETSRASALLSCSPSILVMKPVLASGTGASDGP